MTAVDWEQVRAMTLDETLPLYSPTVYPIWRDSTNAEFRRLLAYRRAVRGGFYSDEDRE
jgi:hypothetical protein